MTYPLAHGIGGIKDLPVPAWLFFYGAAAVLILSFAALAALWRDPLLKRGLPGREAPLLERLVFSTPVRILFGAIGVALFGVVFAAALAGDPDSGANLAPTFVYVVFWLGLVPIVVLIGNVWPAVSPWHAVARATGWLSDRAGLRWEPPLAYPERLGRLPAAALLFAWAALELAYPNAADPRHLGIAIALYSLVTWFGMLAFGTKTWLRSGEAFTVYFGLLGRLAPFAVEEQDGRKRLRLRVPLTGLAGGEERPGTVAFVAVMLGSVAFDGLSRSTWWTDRVLSMRDSVGADRTALADLVVTGFNLLALGGMVALVAAAYLLAVDAARSAARGQLGPEDFLRSLLPIALVYVIAHYFSFFVNQGQVAWRLASDPFGNGRDLFGTAAYEPRFDLLTPNVVWYVQVGALVVGHVLGLVVAHDRAVDVVRSPRLAARSQYPLLGLMVVYTLGGMWLLSRG